MALTAIGRYEVRGELGRGAMGVVYRAWDPVLEREVALKTMEIAGRRNPDEDTVRFLREAKAAGRLHHPNIVTIHELGEDGGTPFIAMELMEGTDLREILTAGELPPLDRRLQIVAEVCRGLDFAHREGIVHRDVKPANIFLLRDGSVKILDFGVAKLASSDATRTGTVIGSVEYMSPEQVRAQRDLDGRSDIFAAGSILYELLFGRTPFSTDHVGSTMMRILHQPPPGEQRYEEVLPPRLSRLLRKALAKSRDDRFQTAGEMARELDAIGRQLGGERGRRLGQELGECGLELDTAPVEDGDSLYAGTAAAGERARGSRASKRRRRGRAWLAAAAAGIVIVLGVGGALWSTRWNGSREDAAADLAAGASPAETAAGLTTNAGADPAGAGAGLATDAGAGPAGAGARVTADAGPADSDGGPADSGVGADAARSASRADAARISEEGAASNDATASAGTRPDSAAPGAHAIAGAKPADETASDGTRTVAASSRETGAHESTTLGPTARESALRDPSVRAVAAPSPAPPAKPGQLALVVVPWARVTSIRHLDRDELLPSGQVTPGVLSLPPGRYRLELVHPSSVEPIVVEAAVRAGERTTVRESVPTPSFMSWIEDRLASESYVLEEM